MENEIIMTLQEASAYCGYKDTKKFMSSWVIKYKVPYENRGKRKFFIRSILNKWLVKIAENNAKKVHNNATL